jgi:CRISPR-associated endonuclease/helicase Cas3
MASTIQHLFWGKAGGAEEKKDPPSHPAICHMLDVALVAQVLLGSASETVRAVLLGGLDRPGDQALRWLAFCTALHDLGKISPGFQAKRIDLTEVLSRGDYPFTPDIDETDHGRITLATLPDILVEKSGCEKRVAIALARAIGGHHGSFHQSTKCHPGKAGWIQARREAVELLRELFGLDWADFPFTREVVDGPFLLALAGLTSVADWIGSSEEKFRYAGAGELDLKAYIEDRRRIAEAAVAALNLDRVPLAPGESRFEALFTFERNDCQRLALEAARSMESPFLLLIETPMGTGKTEAALAVVDVLVRERGAAGFYYALPTMATGNQMFGRVLEFLSSHPAKTAGDMELHLLHSRADLNPNYTRIRSSSIYGEDGCREASVIASSWFAARKRGLISPCAVGTVDQALMAAMQVRHMFVRLYGLAGKVIVIDEVHAYDTYTSTILDRLLAWLGALNASVILLTATLPSKRRRDLLDAYVGSSVEVSAPYPSIVAVDRTGHVESKKVTGLDPRSFRVKTLTGPEADRLERIAGVLRADLRDGGVAACLVNTVDEAQSLFEYLRGSLSFPDGVDLTLFHARFPLARRLDIEMSIETRFGKGPDDEPNPDRPHRAVVVATQVLEQSLDVDFDVMITDLAPIDLVLQRAGRMWRHRKNDPNRRVAESVLYCLLPDLAVARPSFGMSEKIYEPAVLLRSALVIAAREDAEVQLPESVEGLIAQVYGPNRIECPERFDDAIGEWDILGTFKSQQMEFLGREIALAPPTESGSASFLGEMEHSLPDTDEMPKVTRLGRPSITLVVLHDRGGRLVADADDRVSVNLSREPGPSEARALVKSSVSISNPHWFGIFEREEVPTGWQRSPLLRRCRAAVFSGGRLDRGARRLVADPTLGLVFSTTKE